MTSPPPRVPSVMSGTDMLCDFFNQPWLAFTGRND